MARRTKQDAQATREALLDAAERVFELRGVSHTSLAHIAEAAGLTRGAVYWHFKDKAALFNAMMERVTLPMEDGVRVAASGAQDDPLAVTDLYQVFDTSDLPAGVVNIVTGVTADLAVPLAAHEEVAGFWHAGPAAGLAAVDRAAAGNLKPVWAVPARDWTGGHAQGETFLHHATRSKTIWLPYGALPAGSGSATASRARSCAFSHSASASARAVPRRPCAARAM